ncbi:hypothetical protein MMC14_005735 [Varicellaria rhodocarpa]|nr:hypothetical protein [Varicellaria rhodocarpa]
MAVLSIDEVRRSGRATKGLHTKNLDEPEIPTPKRGAKGKRGKAVKEAEATPPPEEEAIIRCICGYVEEDEDDERVMVICDQCEAWQHNECMEISENSEELPDQYYCEQCKPEDHQKLLAKVNRGEKPWEERAKQRKREEEERKQRRRKGGKKGKKARPSDVQPQKVEEPNGKVIPPVESPKGLVQELPEELPTELPLEIPTEIPSELPPDLPIKIPSELPTELPAELPKQIPIEIPTPNPREVPKELPQALPKELVKESVNDVPKEIPRQLTKQLPQRKLNPGLVSRRSQDKETMIEPPPTSGQKRKLPAEETQEMKPSHEQEISSKIRKVSNAVDVKPSPRRKSSAMPAPVRSDSKGVNLQTELVENISELQNEARQRAATGLVKMFVDQTKQAQKQGAITVPPGQALEAFGLRIGLAVEYAIYLNFWGHAGEPSSQYGEKLRMVLHNIKANLALRDRVLSGSLSPNDLSKMTSYDMASKELQENMDEMKKEAEKQHMLVQEEGPRIRRTHKGDELINDDSNVGGTESIFSSVTSRRRDGEIEGPAPRHASPGAISPQSPNIVELPADVSYSGTTESPKTSGPLSLDTKIPPRPSIGTERKPSSTFNIQNVWPNIDTPDAEKQNAPQSTNHQRSSMAMAEQFPAPYMQSDPDIDKLLKDEEPEEEEYSPMDYEGDPGTIWRGNLAMASIASFAGSAKHVAGGDLNGAYSWPQLMPGTLSIDGRIDIEKASSYLCGLQWSKTTEVAVVAITPDDTIDDQVQFKKLFTYFTERNKYGVISKSPVNAIRDTYVVPLEAGTCKKPDFVELLQHCTIEDPRPSRALLVAYVIKSTANVSAQVTPRHADQGVVLSPTGAQTQGQFSNAPPMSFPGPHMSPVTPYTASSYGNPFPTGLLQGFSPTFNGSTSSNPTGIEAARQVLGGMAGLPVIAELLAQAPNAGVVEFGIIKEVFDSVPASRNNIDMLMTLLTTKLQRGQGSPN